MMEAPPIDIPEESDGLWNVRWQMLCRLKDQLELHFPSMNLSFLSLPVTKQTLVKRCVNVLSKVLQEHGLDLKDVSSKSKRLTPKSKPVSSVIKKIDLESLARMKRETDERLEAELRVHGKSERAKAVIQRQLYVLRNWELTEAQIKEKMEQPDGFCVIL